MPGGVVTWLVYEGFQIGEKESNMARNAFETFIPLSADSAARRNIIFDFFDLLAAVAAHGKTNGLGGRKLSRLAGWWAFELSDDGKGFEGGYRSWEKAADATSHLFFAYLRSLSPDSSSGMMLIERIPRSLQALLASTEYPPETPTLLQRSTPKVVMMVDSVSPTPFALLRRARHFEYRSQDHILREYSEFEDPLDALTDECKRVLYSISTTNSSAAKSRHRTMVKPDESWSAFSNMGFADMGDNATPKMPNGANGSTTKAEAQGLRSQPRSRNTDHARPTTPSWADFLSSGFNEEDANANAHTLLVPPDKVLPPINSRTQTPIHVAEGEENLAPGELAAINDILLDDAFWWVWMTSLAGEEPSDRKAVFGRCALIETNIMHGKWLIMEEQIKGASPDPAEGVFVAPKKSLLSTLTKRARLGRKRSTRKEPPQEPAARVTSATPSKSSLAPDQQSKIKQAAAALKRQGTHEEDTNARRGRHEDAYSTKTNSMLTMGLQTEAGPAMKWTSAYDKSTIRAQYLGDAFAGRGISRENLLLNKPSSVNLVGGDGASSVNLAAAPAPALSPEATTFSDPAANRDLPPVPQDDQATPGAAVQAPPPPTVLPPQEPEENDLSPEMKKTKEQAEKVPLPDSAMEKEVAVGDSSSNRDTIGRKPVANTANHPALRQTTTAEENITPQTPTSPKSPTQPAAVLAAQRAMETSPESTKSGQSKLKKQAGAASGGGLKKLFGRKKDNPNRQSVTVNGGSSLAPPAQEPTRRLSLMRKKKAPPAPQATASEPAEPSPAASELAAEPVLPVSKGKYDHSNTNVSQIDPREEAQAEKEFSRFDQGPLDDMPAVTPQSSEHEIVAPQAQRHHSAGLAARLADQNEVDSPNFVTPMERNDPIDEDAQSETTMEDTPEMAQTNEKDRWATIRENAARRAARASEEQSESRPSQSARTDDGETSGEESE